MFSHPLVGHLDRVLHGISAEEVLYACDETTSITQPGESGLANPAVHFLRGLRHRNMSAIRHATQVRHTHYMSFLIDFLARFFYVNGTIKSKHGHRIALEGNENKTMR